MGAWGEGMQANDNALDWIFMSSLENSKTDKDVNAAIRMAVNPVATAMNGAGDADMSELIFYGYIDGLLGCAEWALDHGFALDDDVKYAVTKAVKGELSKSRLQTWSDPDKREDALKRFLERVQTGKFDQDKQKEDNKPLLQKADELYSSPENTE